MRFTGGFPQEGVHLLRVLPPHVQPALDDYTI
jgi:hypothetical protein